MLLTERVPVWVGSLQCCCQFRPTCES